MSNKRIPIKNIECTKTECVFMDHFEKDIMESSTSLVLCIICNHARKVNPI